jgi:TP901 family phage tail tape measure protein
MANSKGIITRKDIIEDEALVFGKTYSDNLQEAITANNQLVVSVKELNKQVLAFKGANSQKDYITAKQAESLATQQAIDAIKKQEAAELSIDKIKRSGIATMEAERKAIQATSDAELKAQKTKERSVKLTVEERVQNEINNKVLKQEALERLGLVSAYTKLNQARTDAKVKLKDLIVSEKASTEEIKKAQKEFDTLDAKVKKADHAVGDFTKNVGNYPKLTAFTSGIKNLLGAFGLIGGVAAFASVIKGAINIVREFDQSVADLSAITGASGKDLEYLKNQAILLGKGVKGGAVAVVEAYKLIASAKPELLENVQALNQVTEAVLTLSKASGMEMPLAATALTDAMNQFGADASQASMFVDALANGAKYGAAEIPQVTDALLKFGAVSRTSNIDIKESTALVELLAENGLKGADAGTALRNVLLKLSAPDALPLKAKIAIERLGISFKDLSDTSKPIQERLEALKPLLKDNAGMVKVFGLENVVAATNILGHTERLKELTSKMGEVGTASEQASIRADTLNGSFDRLESSWSSFVLSLSQKGNGLGSILKGITDELTETVEGWRKIFTTNEKLKEEELSKIRKEGFDSIIKSYGDKTKLNEAQMILIKKSNSEEIAENNNKVNALIADNKRLAKNTVALTGAIKNDSFDIIMANKKKISELNKSSTGLIGKNEGLNSLMKSRKAPAKGASSEEGEAAGGITEKQKADALKRAKLLNDSLYELQKLKLERSIKINKEIGADDEQTDDVRIAALEASQKKEFELVELTKKHKLDYDKFVLSEDRLNANQKKFINLEAANSKVDIEKKTAEEINKINEFDETTYLDNIKKGVSLIEIANNDEIIAEEKRFQAEQALGYKNDKAKEKAAQDHEKILFNIKKEGVVAIAKLQLSVLAAEIDAYEAKANEDGIITEKESKWILAKRKELSDLSVKLIQTEGDAFKANEKDKEDDATKEIAKILQISSDALGALADLSNAFSEAKIQKIDDEIAKNDEYYAKQIELAGNDQRQKDLIQKEQEKKRAELEKKKRDAQNKQAKVDKAVAIAQATISTALAVMKGFSESGYVGAILAGVLGAISIATIIATPIPKYKHGRKDGPKELAYVGDGGVNEIIERKSGLIQMTPNRDTLVQLEAGDKVHSTVDGYYKLQRAAMMASIDMQGRKMSDFQASQYFDSNNKELLAELKRNTEAVKNNKSNIVINTPKIDINHHLWKSKNTNWS